MERITERMKRQIRILKETFKNKESVYVLHQWLETELAYTSNHIEGNTLTRRETALVIEEGITTGGKPLKDYLEAKNHAEAFRYILNVLSKKKGITQDDILKIHSIVLKGIDDEFAGRYRNSPVRIKGSSVVLPNAMKVPDLMINFEKYLQTEKDPFKLAIMGHFKFVSIHPFVDGNGRVARLLMNLVLLQQGFWPIIIRPRDRKKYINSIEKGQLTQDTTAYEEFMYKALERSLDTYVEMFHPQTDESKLLKIGQFAQAVGVPISTVRYWIRIGKLIPVAKSDGDFMLFSKEQVTKFKK